MSSPTSRPGDPSQAPGGAPDAPGPVVHRSARRQFAGTILVLEAFVVLFATLVAFGLRVAPAGVVWLLGGVLLVSLVLVAGLLRWPAGYVAGSALQVPVLAVGVAVPMMFVVGAVFVVLWVVALRLGARIDRERLERGHQVRGR
ncbi:DUF4233 domain-containing protein [Cellulomonas bogoriensis]|uniref:DUF4233 domain-containing protein n=1 Tax=Cellulomonas bogoriensis 69B4 = DSM 16987 TaxID=1386082 RepID=A0A0A0BY05_9CELL|nr:hypothetical protein N869_01545 [Cellulomonas bogoriensis 69B4 = DSM 16987]